MENKIQFEFISQKKIINPIKIGQKNKDTSVWFFKSQNDSNNQPWEWTDIFEKQDFRKQKQFNLKR